MNDLSLHIIDILQNSISAGATVIKLKVEESEVKNLLEIVIEDNGRGMTPKEVEGLGDPFFTSRTTRRVGMGIPLFRHSAEQSGGSLDVESQLGLGTKVTARFELNHIDRAPLGDLANSFVLTLSSYPDIAFLMEYIYNDRGYLFDSEEVKEALEGTPLYLPQVIKLLSEMISENIEELKRENRL
ncbi:MAG: ATP-binding protein [Bacteroidales bacterium]